jgi:two-component system chemotaxis response regulator CheY
MFDLNTKVMVVDDMMTMRKLVSKVLKEVGFKDISEAKDGAEAWTLISAANPPFGLVVSDWNMPNCSGLDLLRRVRADSRFKTLPFLMVTAEAEKHQIVEAVQAGVTNYVIKPFTPDILREKLEVAHKKFVASGG